MKDKIVLLFILAVLTITPVFAALVEDYDVQTTTYFSLDTSLKYHISNTDFLNGKQGTLISGGFHSATVPSDTAGRIATLTDGVFAINGLTVINQDYGEGSPDLVLEYPFTRPYDISTIRVFAGHDGDGSRGWINVKIDVDQGAGYSTLINNLKTGPYFQAVSTANMVSVVQLSDDAGSAATNVNKLKFSFYCVTHNDKMVFTPYDDNTTAGNYPNQGTITKEIDVFGVPTPLTLSEKTVSISVGNSKVINASGGLAPYTWSFSTTVSQMTASIGYIDTITGSVITFTSTDTGAIDLFCFDNDSPASIASVRFIVIPTLAPLFPEPVSKTVTRVIPNKSIMPNRMSWELFE
jgi:hypothetical protein